MPSIPDLLSQLARKCHRGVALTAAEARSIRGRLSDLRAQCEAIFLDCEEDEERTVALLGAMGRFERRKLTQPQCLEALMEARTLRDRYSRGRALRADIAYHLAMSTLFLASLDQSPNPRTRAAIESEIIVHVEHIHAAVEAYRRYQHRRTRREHRDSFNTRAA